MILEVQGIDDILTCEPGSRILVVISLIKAFIQLIQILIPIGLIVMGTIDLGKAVVAADEEKIKQGQIRLAKRFIAAILVFLVALMVRFVMGQVGNEDWKECWNNSNNVGE